jgi:transcriptional regulator with XRE-family HTH domain
MAGVHPEDERLANLIKLVRRRTGVTQRDLARAARVSRLDMLRIESGRAGELRLEHIRRIFDAVGGRARLVPWWNGAAADRLLDEQHAALVERAVRVFEARRWRPDVEVSFSEYGERGSIDILAGHSGYRAIAVCEVKSAIGSLEETNRSLDVKVRLAPRLAMRRFGWRPVTVSRLLIVPRDSSIRRIVQRHAATLNGLYPGRGREVRAWLHYPVQPLGAIWFVSGVRDQDPVPR